MGSYLSRASYSSVVPYNTVKVMLFNGGLQEFHTEMKVAEIMLENPQHFVSLRFSGDWPANKSSVSRL
ncbi:hypothetical protein SUGI_0977110 [Cryptomeria japonica]|nr:hypothetical protein SUGI_0977110 [Cryptomeria japonica]